MLLLFALSEICPDCFSFGASQVALVIKNPPVNARDVKKHSFGPCQEGPLEEGTATHSSILAWKTPLTEEPGRLQSVGSQKSWT